MTRLNRVNPASINQQSIRSQPSRTTIYTAAGTVLAASAVVAGLVFLPADASKPMPMAADTGRHSMAGGLTRASYQSLAGPTARELHELEARAQAAERAAPAARRQAAQGTSATVPATPSGSPQQIATSMLAQFGWSSSQFSCLGPLWERESGWNPSAANPSSGAYGIPQALPGAKMASAGPDWATNASTQIRWGLGYIKATYGSPCAAWAHETADGWY